MNYIQRFGITLATCFCLALPVAAQKNIKSLQRALAQAGTTSTVPLTVKTLKIVNLPARPSVHILLNVPPAPRVKHSIRLLPPRQVSPLLYKPGEHTMFIPRDFVNQTQALYRGMAITGIDELKNILTNGLEVNKSNHKQKIFTAYDPLTAVLYAQPTHRFNANANLPVLIKIPLTPALEQYAPETFPTAQAFRQNIPADAISDVWILLEVNKKTDWYKVSLQDGEIILFPAHGQLQTTK